MSAHNAWALVCRLFAGGRPVFRSALSPTEVRACAALGSAIKPTVLNQSHALCPYCHLHSGRIEGDGRGGQVCQCPECGPVLLAAEDRAAIVLDENWMISKLRIALEIESRDGVTDLGDGVWRLGQARREPVLLSRSLERLWAEPSIFDRVRVAGSGIRVVAPTTTNLRGAPFAAGIEWLPLEERFTFYGHGITHFATGSVLAAAVPADPWTPVHGPFSADFKWATLDDWPHGPIQFTEGQAAVMQALWSFKGVRVSAERVMLKAGQKSSKPNDLFKMKTENIGKPKYEGQLHAYRKLVHSTQRPGEYWISWAGGSDDR